LLHITRIEHTGYAIVAGIENAGFEKPTITEFRSILAKPFVS
jgi:hypothetical protein